MVRFFIRVCANDYKVCSKAPTLRGPIFLNIHWILTQQKRIESVRRGALLCHLNCVLGGRVLGDLSLVELPTALRHSCENGPYKPDSELRILYGFCMCTPPGDLD